MATKQKMFDQLSFNETFEDVSIPHKNFTLLSQESHEIPDGGWGRPTPHWYPMWVTKSLVPQGLISVVRFLNYISC